MKIKAAQKCNQIMMTARNYLKLCEPEYFGLKLALDDEANTFVKKRFYSHFNIKLDWISNLKKNKILEMAGSEEDDRRRAKRNERSDQKWREQDLQGLLLCEIFHSRSMQIDLWTIQVN